MTNSKREYNEFIRANLPYGITYDSTRYQYVTFNGKRFVTYLEAKWYIDYLTKFGGGPEDDIRNDLFGASEEGVWFEANDATTLFTDVAGTTPVTAPGDAVALQLDKSQGLTLGPELVASNPYTVDNDLQTVATIAANTAYEVDFTVSDFAGSGLVGVESGTFDNAGLSVRRLSGNGSSKFIGITGNSPADVRVNTTSTATAVINISVRELPGNHRTQATTAARPLYALHPVGGVRNLLEYTEEFDNAVWNKSSVTVADQGDGSWMLSVPNDGLTVARVISQAAPDTIQQAVTWEVKKVNWRYIIIAGGNGTFGALSYDFDTGEFFQQTPQTGTVPVITPLEDGWLRITFFSGRDDFRGITVGFRNSLINSSGEVPVLGAGDKQLLFRKPLREVTTASSPTAYQKVRSFLDVSEEGKPRRGRLWYNGTSHFMQTGTITPGTDKVQVFAGVRKLSDAAAILVESSTSVNSNEGSFYLVSGEDQSARYSSLGRGSALAAGLAARWVDGGFAPDTAVLTATHDIAGDLSRIRRNGVFGVDATGDKGTGNFLAYPLYFGARGGSGLRFNGYEDTSIIRFGPNLDAGTISKVESYVASKTPEETI